MRYLISGYYGEGNAGDEAILAGILRALRLRDADAEPTVLSFSPADTEKRHRVAAVPTGLRDPRPLLRALNRTDLLISGGGSFLHEADLDLYGHSFLWREGKLRPVPYFLSVVLTARAMGKPVMWYAQGLGPLHTAWARRAVGFAGSVSRAVTWRDRDSALLAAEVGVRAPVERVVPDPAYGLEPADPGLVTAALAARGIPLRGREGGESGEGGEGGEKGRERFMVVCPRPWLDRPAYEEKVTAALTRVAAAEDLAVLFLPLHERLDGPVCRRMASDPRLASRAWVWEPGVGEPIPEPGQEPGQGSDGGPEAGPELLLGLLSLAECVLTVRLHGGILAAAAGTPAAAVAYDPKVWSFARQTGQEKWARGLEEVEGPEGERLVEEAVLDTLYSLPERRAALRRAVAPLKKEAGRTAALAVQIAAGK